MVGLQTPRTRWWFNIFGRSSQRATGARETVCTDVGKQDRHLHSVIECLLSSKGGKSALIIDVNVVHRNSPSSLLASCLTLFFANLFLFVFWIWICLYQQAYLAHSCSAMNDGRDCQGSQQGRKQAECLHGALPKVCMTASSGPDGVLTKDTLKKCLVFKVACC